MDPGNHVDNSDQYNCRHFRSMSCIQPANENIATELHFRSRPVTNGK